MGCAGHGQIGDRPRRARRAGRAATARRPRTPPVRTAGQLAVQHEISDFLEAPGGRQVGHWVAAIEEAAALLVDRRHCGRVGYDARRGPRWTSCHVPPQRAVEARVVVVTEEVVEFGTGLHLVHSSPFCVPVRNASVLEPAFRRSHGQAEQRHRVDHDVHPYRCQRGAVRAARSCRTRSYWPAAGASTARRKASNSAAFSSASGKIEVRAGIDVCLRPLYRPAQPLRRPGVGAGADDEARVPPRPDRGGQQAAHPLGTGRPPCHRGARSVSG